ncbi:MAG: penicillin acylase family protein [Cyclobacteriaceae bacterium]
MNQIEIKLISNPSLAIQLKIVGFGLFALIALNSQGQVQPDKVEIIRDQWGVPHIHAPTDAGATYGLAWAHAEDDFETIQLPLLAAKGLMGTHLGKEGAPIDYIVQLLRLDELARTEYQSLSPAFREVLHAYVDATNQFALHHPERVLLKGVFPIDQYDVLKAYGLSLAVISGADGIIKDIFEGAIDPAPSSFMGSNAIALSPRKTGTDETFLVVNSHQPLEGPVAWYEAHMVSDEGLNMLGGLFPGGPVIFHGTNEHLGWAHTVNYPDKIDVYQLKINPKSKNEYWLDGKWQSLESKKVKLKVKLGPLKIGVKKEVIWSAFGPALRNDKGVFAFNLGVLTDLKAIQQWYEMNKANSLEAFLKALERVSIPGFNIIYADKASNILHVGNAKIPVRVAGYDWDKTLPGVDSKLVHAAYQPLENLPQNLNPSSGVVFNTNNSAYSSSIDENPDPSDYDPTMGYEIWENNRSLRLIDLLKASEQIDYKMLKTIKYDLQLPDSLAYPINLNPVFTISEAGLNDRGSQVLNILRDWDRKALIQSIGPAQAMILYRILNENLDARYRASITPTDGQLVEGLNRTGDYFIDNYNKIDVSLGEFQFLKRGDKSLSIQGMPDVLAAMHSVPDENGRYKAVAGESYIMMVRYPASGPPIIETVNVFGASNVPGSEHYDDQMDLFINQQLKPMSLDIEKVRKESSSIYHPK